MLDLNQHEAAIIHESEDADLDLYQIVYDIHFASPHLSVAEKYQLAVESILRLTELGLIETLEVEYQQERPGVYSISSSRPLPLEEIALRLRHPGEWDRAGAVSPPIVVRATGRGSREHTDSLAAKGKCDHGLNRAVDDADEA